MNMVNEIVMVALDKIKPYEKNPRENSKTVELLVKIIPKVGFNVPLVLDEDNVIVKGHARYCAAKKLGIDPVPCVISHASAEAIKADRIADNRVFEFSSWIDEELMHEIDMFDLDFDAEDFGLPKFEVPDIPFDFDEQDDIDDSETEEERKQRFLEFMKKQGYDEPDVQIVTQQAIDNAKMRQRETAKAPADYIAVTCEKCGEVMYVRKGDAMVWE